MNDASQNEAGADPAATPPERVYLDFYQLAEAPFAITPDPEFLFFANCHQQVLDKISYAIDGRMGFVLLTGEVGTGKTTLCRTLLDRLSEQAETVYVINPSVSGHELLAGILEDLGMHPEVQATKKALIDRLNQRLLSDDPKRPLVVIIDDAQTMTPETLEDLRLLSNLETDKHKLIQVVLSGQPELLDLLADQRLRQLRHRIAVHCRLEPLSTQETGGYISRRLYVAGNQGQVSFSHAATQLIHKTSGGIPRLINKICDFALTAGYVEDTPAIGPSHVKRALVELGGLEFRPARSSGHSLRDAWPAGAVLALGLTTALFFSLYPGALFPGSPIPTVPYAMDGNPPTSPVLEPLDSVSAIPTALPLSAEPAQATAKAMAPGASTVAVISDTQDDIVRTAAGPEKAAPPQPFPPAPYALQLGSFRTLARAEQSVSQYRQKAVPAHWQMVENGRWYRIVAGKFESMDQATHYKSGRGLKEALIIQAPWTVKVLPRHPDISDVEILRFISEIGLDSLMETGLAGDNEFYTGLFVSVADASITAERINSSGRLLAQVVSR